MDWFADVMLVTIPFIVFVCWLIKVAFPFSLLLVSSSLELKLLTVFTMVLMLLLMVLMLLLALVIWLLRLFIWVFMTVIEEFMLSIFEHIAVMSLSNGVKSTPVALVRLLTAV
jgi:hypothetical protein